MPINFLLCLDGADVSRETNQGLETVLRSMDHQSSDDFKVCIRLQGYYENSLKITSAGELAHRPV